MLYSKFSLVIYFIHSIYIYIYFGEGNGTPLQHSCLENPMDWGAWWAAVHGVAKSQIWLNDFTFTFHFHALEKEMATHSSVLAWRIPGTEEPGGLPSMGSHRVRHDWSDLAAAYIYIWRRKWQPTPVFLPGESQGWVSLVGCRLGSHRGGHDWSDLAAAAVYIYQSQSPKSVHPPLLPLGFHTFILYICVSVSALQIN